MTFEQLQAIVPVPLSRAGPSADGQR
jgi:hypothetical protein